MEEAFWHERWQANQIGFHEPRPNPLLVRHLAALGLKPGARLFLPLCGKSLDIHWLLAEGYHVVGAELSALAIDQLFAELGERPSVTAAGALERRAAGRLVVFVGDVFALTRETLGAVDAVYDRAALVALPPPMRDRYAPHVAAIAGTPPQLLVTLEYDQSVMPGPPFSIGEGEVRARYEGAYRVELLEAQAVEGGLKGRCPATESLWLLQPR
jgi:thiopurine S-methyltransferase